MAVTLDKREKHYGRTRHFANTETPTWQCKVKLKMKETTEDQHSNINQLNSLIATTVSAPSPTNSTASLSSSNFSGDSDDIFSDFNSNLELFHSWKDVSILTDSEYFLMI